MKKVLFAAMISVMVLTACGKREMTLEEIKAANGIEVAKSVELEKIKNYPESQIIGKVANTNNVLIHKFVDKESNKICYFLDYRFDGLSCVSM